MLGRYLCVLAMASATSLCPVEAGATAFIGGPISAIAGSGLCNDSHSVPTNTQQDSFTLSAATACAGGAASGAIRGDAATASVGIKASSSGNGIGSSQVAGQISFVDTWLLSVPTGTAQGFFNIPVSITLDGTVSSGAEFGPGFGRFMDYNLTISDAYAPLLPGSSFSALGSITATGTYAQTFNGSVNFYYWGPSSLPSKATVELSLSIPGLYEGTVDFYNTAAIVLDLPEGFSATTSSGLPLAFTTAPPPTDGVPEPLTLSVFAAGLVGAGVIRRRKVARPKSAG